MQTREPRKRVNWIFVIVLIIIIPLTLFTIFMFNTLPPKTSEVNSSIDSVEVDSSKHFPDDKKE